MHLPIYRFGKWVSAYDLGCISIDPDSECQHYPPLAFAVMVAVWLLDLSGNK
jgi:hypothetical protein